MRKEYLTPEVELVKFTLKDVILASIIEETIHEDIGGDQPGDPIDGDF